MLVKIESNITASTPFVFQSVDSLIAETTLGAGATPAGTMIEAAGFRYEVAASGATDQHVTTAGGVKLYVLPDASGVRSFAAFGVSPARADNYAIMQAALNLKGIFFLPAGEYVVSSPLVISSDTTLRGAGSTLTVIRKNAASTNADGIDAIISTLNASASRRIVISDLQVVGNRAAYALGNGVTTHGVYLWSANNFTVENVVARSCLNGFWFRTCWLGQLNRITAQTCQDYGIKTSNSCTSLTFISPLIWGCKGGMDISASVYFTVISMACDQSDNGKWASDPFLPEGSGGDYQNPGFIFRVVASRGSLINCGCESGFSQFLYAEGAFLDVVNPYAYDLKCAAANWTGIYLAQTGKSIVNISNPNFNFVNTLSVAATRVVWDVDTPRVQSVNVSNYPSLDTSFGQYAYPVDGVRFPDAEAVISVRPENMVVGQRSTLYGNPANILTEVVDTGSGVKRLDIQNQTASAKTARTLIAARGKLICRVKGSHSSAWDLLTIRVVGDNGTSVDVLYTTSVSSAFDKIFVVELDKFTPDTTKPIYFEVISPHSSDTTLFEVIDLKIVS